jgi:hypothetical protein
VQTWSVFAYKKRICGCGGSARRAHAPHRYLVGDREPDQRDEPTSRMAKKNDQMRCASFSGISTALDALASEPVPMNLSIIVNNSVVRMGFDK